MYWNFTRKQHCKAFEFLDPRYRSEIALWFILNKAQLIQDKELKESLHLLEFHYTKLVWQSYGRKNITKVNEKYSKQWLKTQRRFTFLLAAASIACFNKDMPTSLTCCREVNLLRKWKLTKSAMKCSIMSDTYLLKCFRYWRQAILNPREEPKHPWKIIILR